jgi:hypothetical protein
MMSVILFDHNLGREIETVYEVVIEAEQNKLSTKSLSNHRLVGRDDAKY